MFSALPVVQDDVRATACWLRSDRERDAGRAGRGAAARAVAAAQPRPGGAALPPQGRAQVQRHLQRPHPLVTVQIPCYCYQEH